MKTETENRKTVLSRCTIDALNHKAGIASDQVELAQCPEDDAEGWRKTQVACESVAKQGTVEALKSNTAARGELEDYLGGDMAAYERNAIVGDLCRAGWYERFDPDVVCTRRQRTRTVDGVKYTVG